MSKHTITRLRDTSHPNGNLHYYTSVCSCGWKGWPVHDYNDDQMRSLGRQEFDHMREVQAQGGGNG